MARPRAPRASPLANQDGGPAVILSRALGGLSRCEPAETNSAIVRRARASACDNEFKIGRC
jgi:hypothetical protein